MIRQNVSMTGTGNRHSRQQRIVEHVTEHGVVSPAELSELTGVSVMTIHRDIAELAGRGIVRKHHGGVSALPSTVFESSSEVRLRTNTAAKNALAHAALRFLSPGMSVMLDDSTTVLALARLLPRVGPLTVVTNYRQGLEELRESSGIRLIAVGGEYSRTHDSYIGLPAQEMISRLSVDIAIQSTSGIDGTMTYHQEQELVMVKRAILAAGNTNVLLMDDSKVGRTALHRFAEVSAFDHVLLTGPVDDDILASLRERTQVELVPG